MRVLICELVPNEKVATFGNVGQAANTYILNFTAACSFTKTFAFVPIQIIPIQNFENTNNIEYFQSRKFKHKGVFKALNRLIESFSLLSRLFRYRKSANVWFYNITQHYFLIYVVAKYIFGSRVYVLLADLYLNENKFSLNSLFIKLINKSDGVISLSRGAEKLKIKKLSISNGIISPATVVPTEVINKNDYLFSGVLSKMKGIDLALEAFSRIPDKRLIISGMGPMLETVKEYASRFPNIEYLGWLDYASYIKVLNEVNFCLSFRNPGDPENQYNFPSKIIEFLQYGKIVISTFNYPDIPQELLIHTGYDFESVKNTIHHLESTSDDALLDLSNNAKSFVNDNFSYKAINDLVSKIERD